MMQRALLVVLTALVLIVPTGLTSNAHAEAAPRGLVDGAIPKNLYGTWQGKVHGNGAANGHRVVIKIRHAANTAYAPYVATVKFRGLCKAAWTDSRKHGRWTTFSETVVHEKSLACRNNLTAKVRRVHKKLKVVWSYLSGELSGSMVAKKRT